VARFHAAAVLACFCWTIRAVMPTRMKKPATMRITVIQLAGFQLMMDVFSI